MLLPKKCSWLTTGAAAAAATAAAAARVSLLHGSDLNKSSVWSVELGLTPRQSRSGFAAVAGDAAAATPNGAVNGAADDAAANDPAADNSAAAVSGVSVGAIRGPIASKSLTKSSIAMEV